MATPIWYNALLALAKPFYKWRIRKRAENQQQYDLEILQRFGDFLPVKNKNAIWIHAVSVGETNAIQPLITHYLQQGQPVLLTNTTKTGQERAKQLFAKYEELLQCVYLPVDQKAVIQQFLHQYQPKLLGLVETELWANLIDLCRQQGIPCLLLNGRLSAKSAQSYAKFPSLTKPMLKQLNQLLAQDEATKQRFISLGMPEQNIQVVGNIKFDMQANAAQLEQAKILQQQWQLEQRKTMLLASTHKDEEHQILKHLKQALQADPQLLCIVVPRHPERFDEVMQVCQDLGLMTHRRSLGEMIQADTQVYLADTMGEMWLWYALSQACFVGGSLNEAGGGHNILEPMLLDVATCVGYKYFNFQTIVDEFHQHQAIKIAQTTQQAAEFLLADVNPNTQTQHQIQQAQQLLQKNQGSLQRHIQAVDYYLT